MVVAAKDRSEVVPSSRFQPSLCAVKWKRATTSRATSLSAATSSIISCQRQPSSGGDEQVFCGKTPTNSDTQSVLKKDIHSNII